MQIVIEIPEDKYKRIVEKYDTFPVEMKEWGLDSIKNGTPIQPEEDNVITKYYYKGFYDGIRAERIRESKRKERNSLQDDSGWGDE